ncbi:zf-TFIIB domain-containing protein [Leifsonia sp. F6_8S_P_1B]|uniref:Zf-TFIIB domain-containing protein n=1 Tax=Leifsonia williamsii TaxID=3035919 RepID=A0ABT8KCH0_9MICO|nr:zf-TFIIB domain-containing protein [Leifsonia williamsii]MDN4615160.1 zf-TFIIB domain-containing protein [Leifsonia williamsii]
MKCPTDNATLVMSERSGIEIDYCPECRGVWLDRGELDKIIDRAGAGSTPAQPQQGYPQHQAPVPPAYPQQAYPQQHQYPQEGQYPYKKKRENWLSELFD